MLTSELSVATYTKPQMCPGTDPEGEHSRGITVSDCREASHTQKIKVDLFTHQLAHTEGFSSNIIT